MGYVCSTHPQKIVGLVTHDDSCFLMLGWLKPMNGEDKVVERFER